MSAQFSHEHDPPKAPRPDQLDASMVYGSGHDTVQREYRPWFKHTAQVVAALALAAGGVPALYKGLSALDREVNGIAIERCMDQPLPADSVQIPPEPEPQKNVSLPDSRDYPSRAAYLKALHDAVMLGEARSAKYREDKREYDDVVSPSPIVITPEAAGVKGEPIWVRTVESTIRSATVIIETPNSNGTGFAVKDPKTGEILIVTAAHVPGKTGSKMLKVIKPDGESTNVFGGCYIYDDSEQGKSFFGDLDSEEIVEADVAILKLKDASGLKPLSLATRAPRRGTWVRLVNYGGFAPTIGNPSDYSGLVTTSNRGEKSYKIVSGFNPYEKVQDTTIQGSSGGPVVDKDGQVVGAVYYGLSDRYYESAVALRAEHLVVSDADAELLRLKNGGVMEPSTIRRAIDALREKDEK